jgi:hypothetical protein
MKRFYEMRIPRETLGKTKLRTGLASVLHRWPWHKVTSNFLNGREKRKIHVPCHTIYYNKDPQKETKITAHLTWKKKKLGIYLCRKRERKGHFIQGRFGFNGTL